MAVQSLESIPYFLQVSDDIATAGQPSDEQLAMIAAHDYAVVINLALHDAYYSLLDERASVKALGMIYEHLPIPFDAPTREHFIEFLQLMDRYAGRRLFIHCAENKRVSTFIALYRMHRLGCSRDNAWQGIHALWQPDPVWTGLFNDLSQQPLNL